MEAQKGEEGAKEVEVEENKVAQTGSVKHKSSMFKNIFHHNTALEDDNHKREKQHQKIMVYNLINLLTLLTLIRCIAMCVHCGWRLSCGNGQRPVEWGGATAARNG